MRRRLYLVLIGLGIAAQFGVLGAMIARRELALRHGEVFRFRTAPVDPFDAFRGKFVALSIDGVGQGLLTDRRFERNQRVYIRVGADTNGLSVIEGVAAKPDASARWLPARVDSCWEEYKAVPAAATNGVPARLGAHLPGQSVLTGKYRTRLDLPFDRYYLDERLAPEAESVYREASRRGRQEAVVTVRSWHGVIVIERLEIGGRPIRDVARERRPKK